MARELQRQSAGVELLLDYLPVTGIQAYFGQRFGPMILPDDWLYLLDQRTHGNPFFLVTMVEELIRQGVLVQDTTSWRLHAAPAAMPVEVPETIEHLIDFQLRALKAETHDLLTTASVVGAEFSAAALAETEQAVETIDAECAALARRGQFVQTQGEIACASR